MMKKRNMIVLAVMLSLSASSLYAKTDFKQNTFVQKAMGHVPKGSVVVNVINKDNEVAVRLVSKEKDEIYEVEMDAKTKDIKEVKSKKVNGLGSKSVNLSTEAIKKIILNNYKDAKIISIALENDDNYKKYEVKFLKDNFVGKVEMNPITGDILEKELDYKVNDEAVNIKNIKNIVESNLPLEKVKEITLNKIPNSRIESIEKEFENGRYIYEIEALKEGFEYELKLDAKTGKEIFLHKDLENWLSASEGYTQVSVPTKQQNLISEEKAKSIASAKVPNGKITEIELENDDKGMVYNIELIKGQMEYSLEVDGMSGKIIEFESEAIDD